VIEVVTSSPAAVPLQRRRAAPREHTSARRLTLRRAAPTLLAAALAAAYVVVAPKSADLAAALLRAKLFGAAGFGIWNNWWYAGHSVPGYSVLFPALAWLATPQVVGAIGAAGAAWGFEQLAWWHFGPGAWIASLWFGAATVTELLSGRMTFALGLFGVALTALALQRRRWLPAVATAILTALVSPVAALFAAFAGGVAMIAAAPNPVAPRHPSPVPRDDRRMLLRGLTVVAGSLAPVAVVAVLFGEGGGEPFAFSALWPVLLICVAVVAVLPATERPLRIGVIVYAGGVITAYLVPTAVGSNAIRLATLAAPPLFALACCSRGGGRWSTLLAVAAIPLLYVQWQQGVADVIRVRGDPSTSAAFYAPLERFLEHRPGGAGALFRVEVPFTRSHWESYLLAPRFPLARGWERQLDVGDDSLFYEPRLTIAAYDRWLHALAVRYVAVPDVPLDSSARQEVALIDRGVPFLSLVMRSPQWRVYAVADPTPIVSGSARLTAIAPDSLTLDAARAGESLVRVRWSPYWRLSGSPGCVAPSGQFTRIDLHRPGPVRLVIDFDVRRIGASSPRCTSPRGAGRTSAPHAA
jgi:hypothetical protein